jgi:3-carboxy-cis,cis-muconate cycloisomerase
VKNNSHFNLLDWLYMDDAAAEIFSFDESVKNWVAIEIALAETQNQLGLVPDDVLVKIQGLKGFQIKDADQFFSASVNVGYPIVELLKELNDSLEPSAQGFLHLGATTQDIMDTALAMQVKKCGELIEKRVLELGDILEKIISKHSASIMPGRTHAQHAVPITFGFKMSIFLSELTRHLERIRKANNDSGSISLFGAGGTSAGYGKDSAKIRAEVAKRLNLNNVSVPWHVSRDRFIQSATASAMIATTLTRLAREIIDLSRTEVLEVAEPGGWHKGASSTMPQKRNPVMSESIIGLAVTATGNAAMMFRAGEAGHERAAGEWQLEWKVLPETLVSTASALKVAIEMCSGLTVNVENMKANLNKDDGLIMAEALMIGLAPKVGRERAHDLVYSAVGIVRSEHIDLIAALKRVGEEILTDSDFTEISSDSYLGEAVTICKISCNEWQSAKLAY